ncbi:MAG TPA: alpha/beta hydrolase [Polyangia bacterium]|nr:alpha/beta hydrolase [Polyangia bacterium]
MKVTKVSFVNPASHARLAGLLFEPKSEPASERRPGIVVVGPMFSVKEQASSVYARRMAQLGYVALAFDHTSFGESEGEPRLNEDPFMKAEDAKSAVTYLISLPQVDPERIGGVGVCGGGGYLPLAAASDPRIKVLASIVPHTAVKEQVASGFGGLYGNGEKILADARAARLAYEQGQPAKHLTFMPKISRFTRGIASLSPKYRDMLKAIDYYEDPNRGLHPNRKKDFLIWSAEKMAAYDVADALPRLESVPLLVITSQRDYARADGEKLYADKKGPKEFHLIAKAGHFDLYDLEPYVTEAVDRIRPFFLQNLR